MYKVECIAADKLEAVFNERAKEGWKPVLMAPASCDHEDFCVVNKYMVTFVKSGE